MSHEFLSQSEGQEGVFVDEENCGDCTHLCCDVRDEEGELILHTELPLGITPEEISEFLLDSADSVLTNNNPDFCLEKSYEIADNLRRCAWRVPGL